MARATPRAAADRPPVEPLAGRRCVVTGASSGIGRAILVALASAGADVVGSYRMNAEGAEDTMRLAMAAAGAPSAQRTALPETPGKPIPPDDVVHGTWIYPADLATADGCAAFVQRAFARLGGVDVWVNNAGADVLTGEAAGWDAERKLDLLLDVDLRGTMRCSWDAGARMRAQDGGGAIVNVGWDQATTGLGGENPELFSAVKAGVLGFSKSLARSLAPDVRVNVVAPGWISTAFGEDAPAGLRAKVEAATPLGRWGAPEDVAGAVRWLASPDAAFVTGQVVNVNGGLVG